MGWDGFVRESECGTSRVVRSRTRRVVLHTISFISRSFFLSLPVPRQPLVRTLNRDRRPRLGFTQPITLTRVIDGVRSRDFTSFAPSVNTRTLRDGSLNSVGQSEVLIHHIEISDLHVEVHD